MTPPKSLKVKNYLGESGTLTTSSTAEFPPIIIKVNESDMEKHLIKDTKKRTKERDELDTMSKVAIWAGFIAFIAVLLYAGVVVDAVIGTLNLE